MFKLRGVMERVYWLGRTWYWRSKFVQSCEKSLTRRATVEQILLNVANKKRLPLTLDECRGLALMLGDHTHGKS